MDCSTKGAIILDGNDVAAVIINDRPTDGESGDCVFVIDCVFGAGDLADEGEGVCDDKGKNLYSDRMVNGDTCSVNSPLSCTQIDGCLFDLEEILDAVVVETVGSVILSDSYIFASFSLFRRSFDSLRDTVRMKSLFLFLLLVLFLP